MAQTFKKASKYITFGSGWLKTDDEGNLRTISCTVDHTKNAKGNNNQGYKVFLFPVDDSGEAVGEPIEVKSFALTHNDKEKFPKAPDMRVFLGVD